MFLSFISQTSIEQTRTKRLNDSVQAAKSDIAHEQVKKVTVSLLFILWITQLKTLQTREREILDNLRLRELEKTMEKRKTDETDVKAQLASKQMTTLF